MFAVMVDGGRQYRVEKGNRLMLDYREAAKPGDAIQFEQVLLAGTKAGSEIGYPLIAGASVQGEVVQHHLGKKLEIGHFKRRKKVRRHTGHRQKYTAVTITAINVPGMVDDEAAAAATLPEAVPASQETASTPISTESPESTTGA